MIPVSGILMPYYINVLYAYVVECHT